MDPNIPTQPVQNQTPVTQMSLQQTTAQIPSSGNEFKWALLIVVLLLIIGSGAYYLGIRQNKSIVQKQVTPTVTQSIPTPTLNPTTNWEKYANTKYGFSIKYPTDTRVLKEQNQQVMGALNPASVVASISLISSDFRLSSTGVSIAVDATKDCSLDQNGQKITKTKDFNDNTFLIAGENIEDDASGGERHLYDIYNMAHNNTCFQIQLSVGYTDVTFSTTQPSAQEIQKQQDWIKTQEQLNDQILSTFKFTN